MRSRGAASSAAPHRSRKPAVSLASSTSCAQSDVTDLVHLELERGDDAEVRAGAAHGPEQIGVLLRSARMTEPSASTISTARRWSMVRPCSRTSQPIPPAVASPPTPDPAVVARAQRPAVRRERGRDVHPARAGPDPDPSGLLVQHLDRVQLAQVDDDAAVVGRATADAVPAAAHRQRHVLGPGERQREHDLSADVDLEHQPGRPAAHVGRPDPRIPDIARLDHGIRQRGRDGVVVDAGPPFGTDGQAPDAGAPAGRPDARSPAPPRAARASPPRRTLQRPGIVRSG